MSTFFISDLHLGHTNILKYEPSRQGETIDEHDDWLVEQWNSAVKGPKDLVWVLGDVCFDITKLPILSKMNGRKNLILGNHDEFNMTEYQKYFESIYGLHHRYGLLLSHAPIHNTSLRGKFNIHGHVHSRGLESNNHFNVCVETLNGVPAKLDEIKWMRSLKQTARRREELYENK